ncbi:MAG: FAD-dependent oxidoreductase, partial [Bacteroidales bacterium]|nr:FAD-dependent oxidoreductase [Bacteroidales bacterium]
MTPLYFQDIEVKLPTNYREEELRKKVAAKAGVDNFRWELLQQSLDARHKPDVFWLARVRVFSETPKGSVYEAPPQLTIHYRKRQQQVVVTGSGPAVFIAALVLQQSGFNVTLLEKGPEAGKRYQSILDFERGKAAFDSHANYCHGEGGAGSFSDGKLT